MERGKFLHDLIKWDFENGIWNIGYGQGFELLRLFERKAIRAGFVIDDSMIRGMKLGLPHNISSVYRRKDNLLASFKGIKEECIYKSTNERYNVRCRYEISSYKHPSSQGYAKRLIQLWRIPAGCSTGIIANEGRVTCIVMKGKCLFEASRWSLYCETTDDQDAGKESWHEILTEEYLRSNQSGFSRANRQYEREAPQEAWYRITNTGKSDLILFVADVH